MAIEQDKTEDLVRQHESALAVWIVRSYSDVAVLRVRKSQPLVYPGLRGRLRVRVGLRVFTRGLAFRTRRGGLDHCGGATMVDGRGATD
jgi:hypothetical protein